MDVTDAVTTVYPGESVPAVVDEFEHLRRISLRALPPSQVDRHVEELRERITRDAAKPGFQAVTARVGSRLCGFGTAVRTADVIPAQASPGAQRSQQWPAGAVRITDLTVAPAARGRGVGTLILDVLLRSAEDDRGWVSAEATDRTTLAFFHCRGWLPPTFPDSDHLPAEGSGIVLLAPGRPALSAAAATSR